MPVRSCTDSTMAPLGMAPWIDPLPAVGMPVNCAPATPVYRITCVATLTQPDVGNPVADARVIVVAPAAVVPELVLDFSKVSPEVSLVTTSAPSEPSAVESVYVV